MMDFNFRTLNVENLAQKNKEDAMNAMKLLSSPGSGSRQSTSIKRIIN